MLKCGLRIVDGGGGGGGGSGGGSANPKKVRKCEVRRKWKSRNLDRHNNPSTQYSLIYGSKLVISHKVLCESVNKPCV